MYWYTHLRPCVLIYISLITQRYIPAPEGLQCALMAINIVALWRLLHLGCRMYAYTLWGRIALWSHQSAQTASSERSKVWIVNSTNPRECSNCTGSKQNIQRTTMCPHGYHHSGFMATPEFGTQDVHLHIVRKDCIIPVPIYLDNINNHPNDIKLFYRPTLLHLSTTSRATQQRLQSLLAACSRSMTSASSMPTGVLTVILMRRSCQSHLTVSVWIMTNQPLMTRANSGCVLKRDGYLRAAYTYLTKDTLMLMIWTDLVKMNSNDMPTLI